MIRGRLAIAGKGGIGRDRLDTQEREQPLKTIVEIGVDAVKNGLQLGVGHFCFPALLESLNRRSARRVHRRRSRPPSAPRTSERPTEPPIDPATDLPRLAATPPTTLSVTERVTLRVMS